MNIVITGKAADLIEFSRSVKAGEFDAAESFARLIPGVISIRIDGRKLNVLESKISLDKIEHVKTIYSN